MNEWMNKERMNDEKVNTAAPLPSVYSWFDVIQVAITKESIRHLNIWTGHVCFNDVLDAHNQSKEAYQRSETTWKSTQ